MKDDLAEAQRERVKAVFERWTGPLGLRWQRRMTYEWHRGPIPGHEQAAMTRTPSWEYKEVALGVNLCRVSDLDDEDLEWAIVHELMHVFLAGLIGAYNRKVDNDAFRMIEEHTASSLAHAVMWLRVHCEPKEESTS